MKGTDEMDDQDRLRSPAEGPAIAAEEDDADRIVSRVETPRTHERVTFSSGREVTVLEAQHESLVVRGPGGEVELRVRFTPEGPMLSFAAAAIDLSAKGAVSIDCEALQVRARQDIAIEADAVSITSRLGDVRVHANDDVVMEGERIRLN
jgi:hypothetical protein